MRRALTSVPGLGRTVTGIAVGAVLAGGLAVHSAQAAGVACPTFTDPSGDTTTPGDTDVDLTSVTYTVVDGRFKAILGVAGLGDGPRLGTGDVFRTTFTVAEKNVSFTYQRTTAPMADNTTTGTVGSTALKSAATDVDTTKKTVTISASADEMETAAGVALTGKPFSVMKASSSTVNPIPMGPTVTDSAAAPAAATYAFGDTCADATPTETDTASPDPSDTSTPDPSGSATPSETPSATPTASPTPTGTGKGGFVALPTPVRVLDTRRTGTPVSDSLTFSLADRITGSATAAVLNVTSVGSTANGNLVVHRTAVPDPKTSSLNWVKGVTQANEVTAALDATKSLTIDVHAGTTHVVVDLIGYITDDPSVESAGLLALRTPERIFDKKIEEGATVIQLQPSQLRAGTTGIRINVTVDRPAAGTYVAVYPGDQERPGTSTVNVAKGATQSNETFVRLAADRTFKVDLGLGVSRVIVDLLGTYGAPVTNAGTIVPLEQPRRLVDTRRGIGAPTGKRTNGTSLAVPLGTVPDGVVGVVLSVTSTQAGAGYVTAHPGGTSRPNTSTLNLSTTSDRAHQVIVGRGTGNPLLSLVGGPTHLVVDLVGYVTLPSSATPTASPSATASSTESPDPSATPSDDPSATPSDDPSATPSDDPSATPSATASPTPSPTCSAPIAQLC